MKRTFLFVIISLFISNTYSQDVYNVDIIKEIDLHFYNTNWRDSLDSYYLQGVDSVELADVIIAGESFDSVGVRWKGNSSCSPGQIKNPLHIELDYKKNQDYQGVKTFKLSNLFKEPSFVREVTMYEFLNWYMPASRANFVNVSVDGSLLGFYVSIESVNKDFIEEHFGSRNNPRFKCDPLHFVEPPTPIPGCGFPPPNTSAALMVFSPDTACYQYSYEMKSDYGWQELLSMMERIRFDSYNVRENLNLDRTIWMLAFDNLFVNLDSYIGSGHNYYIYENDSNKFNPIIWDLNEIFGTFKEGMNPTELKNLSLWYKTEMPQRPLLRSLLNIPANRKKYLAHYRTLVHELVETDTIVKRCIELQTMIDSYVQADPNKLFTYTDFQNSMTQDIGIALGISPFLSDRYSYVSNDVDYLKTPPSIISVEHPITQPLCTDKVVISTIITNANNCILGFRTGSFDPFVYLQMYDDGNHDDGAANDGIYAAEIPAFPANTQVDYYVYAENSEAGTFLPVRAEYEFFSYTVVGETITEGAIVINEFMASNSTFQADQDGEFDDWIELYNPTDFDIELKSAYLSDDKSNVLKWQFPDTIMQASSYLIIWADKDEIQQGLHANFKLSASGESVVLSNFDGSVIDSISYPQQAADTSYGRFPNAYGPFQIINPTFNAENFALSINKLTAENIFRLYPNPTKDNLRIIINKDISVNEIVIIDFIGKQIKIVSINNLTNIIIDVSDLNKGVYFVRIGHSIQKFLKD